MTTEDNVYDMASVSKEADDMNDELFGALKKGGRDSKKNADKGEGVKKKIGYGEFDDSDPLGDISLSDDDFFGVGETASSNKLNPTSSSLSTGLKQESEKPTRTTVNNLDKPSKSKLIADLFGLEETENSTEQPIVEKKKSDWLGIKESPKRSVKINDNISVEKSESLSVNNPLGNILKKQLSEDEIRIKPPSRSETSKAISDKDLLPESKLFSKTDDISNLLTENKTGRQDKTSKSGLSEKKKDISEELFGKANFSKSSDIRSSTLPTKENETNQTVVDDRLVGKRPEDSSGVSQYLPSSGSGRRAGFGRRRDGAPASLGLTKEVVSNQRDGSDDNWLFGANKREEKNPIQSDPLPSWLGGDNKSNIDSSSKSTEKNLVDNTAKGGAVVPKAKSAPIIKEKNRDVEGDCEAESTQSIKDEPELKELLTASSALDRANSAALVQMESGLFSAVQIKQHKDIISELVSRQTSLLKEQEQQMSQLIEQQVWRQHVVENNMKKQQERINMLLQALLTGAEKDTGLNVLRDEVPGYSLNVPSFHQRNDYSDEKSNSSGDEVVNEYNVKNSNVKSKTKMKIMISKLETAIQKLEMEKATLEQRLEIQESRHSDEMKLMEKFHRHEISSWEEKEEQLKQRLADLKTDFEERIAQLQDQREKLILQHNIRIESLQQEKLEDLKQLGEFHRLSIEQVTNISKLLMEDSRLVEKKRALEESRPLDVTELSSREAALIKKESEISEMKSSLEKQRLTLAAEKDEMEAKFEQEKRILEENNRRLRKQQSDIKYKEEEFYRDQEREKDSIKALRKQLEELKESALREQQIAMEERLQLTANQARLDALAKLQGQEPSAISCIDLIQAKGEMEGALAAAKEVKSKVEEDKLRLHKQQINLEAEKWRLQELETELLNKQHHIEHLQKVSEAQHKEGISALEQAKLKEKRSEERFQEAEQRLLEVSMREKIIMKKKLEMTKERAILEKKRSQLDFILPNLTQTESITLGLQPKAIIDPKLLIMRLKAEKQMETS